MPKVEIAGKTISFKTFGDFKAKVQEELQIVDKELSGVEETYKGLKKRQRALLKTLKDGEGSTSPNAARELSKTGS